MKPIRNFNHAVVDEERGRWRVTGSDLGA